MALFHQHFQQLCWIKKLVSDLRFLINCGIRTTHFRSYERYLLHSFYSKKRKKIKTVVLIISETLMIKLLLCARVRRRSDVPLDVKKISNVKFYVGNNSHKLFMSLPKWKGLNKCSLLPSSSHLGLKIRVIMEQ